VHTKKERKKEKKRYIISIKIFVHLTILKLEHDLSSRKKDYNIQIYYKKGNGVILVWVCKHPQPSTPPKKNIYIYIKRNHKIWVWISLGQLHPECTISLISDLLLPHVLRVLLRLIKKWYSTKCNIWWKS
jgi:hypothetical protein